MNLVPRVALGSVATRRVEGTAFPDYLHRVARLFHILNLAGLPGEGLPRVVEHGGPVEPATE